MRGGLEASIWAGPVELVTSNAVQVQKVRQIIESMGLLVATSDEAWAILSLKGGHLVGF